jgi:transcriptional regulator with XRE-family HTH domain
MSDANTRGRGTVIHPRIVRAIAKLGEDISYARRVRRIGAEDFAQRIGISRATLHRLESGDPGVALSTLAMALHAIGKLDALSEIADPANDHVAMMQMKDDAPKRIGRPRAARHAPEDVEDTVEAAYEGIGAESKFKGF